MADDDALPVFRGKHEVYEATAKLGEGAMGVTYRVRRRSDSQTFVLKELRLERVAEWKAVELFEREIATLASLDHPGIPKLVDSLMDREQGLFALVQSEIPGRTLAELIRGHESVDVEQLERWLRGALDILAYLHGRAPPVVHRDINPANIMVDGEHITLIDFGAVKVALRDSTTMTSVGTFGYMAPEHIRGRAEPASDLFGLGMSFVALATGCAPGDLPVDRATGQIDAGEILTLPEPLRSLILDMIAPGLDERMADAASALARLERGRDRARAPVDEPAPTATLTDPPAGARWRRRRRRLGRASGALLTLVLGGGWIASVIPSTDEVARLGGWFSGHGTVLGGMQATLLGDIYGMPRAYVEAVAFDADGLRVATASEDGVRVWSVPDGDSLAVLPSDELLDADPTWLAFGPDSTIVVGDHRGRFSIYNLETGLLRRSLSSSMLTEASLDINSTHLLGAHVSDRSGSSSLVAALWGEREEGPKRWSTHSLVVQFDLEGHGERVLLARPTLWKQIDDAAFSANGERVALVGGGALGDSSDGATLEFRWSAQVFALDDLSGLSDGSPPLFETSRDEHDIRELALDETGERLATLSYDGITWWSVASGERLQHHAMSGAGYDSRLSAGPRGLLTLVDGRRTSVFSPEGERLAEFGGHRIRVLAAAIDPSGSYLVTGGADELAKLWSLPPAGH